MGDIGKRRVNNKNRMYVLVICMAAIYFIRLLFLDADVKNFGIGQVHPADELFYNELALRIDRYGLGEILKGDGLTELTLANSKTFVLPALLSALFIRIFGNNYYGLRIPYVLMGFVVALLLLGMAKKLFENKMSIVFMVVAAYLFDFNMFMLSRSAVTILPSMLASTIFLYGILVIKSESVKMFFMGFWPIITFCLVYAGMEFLVITSVLYVVVLMNIRNGQNDSVASGGQKQILFYLTGIVVGILISELLVVALFRQHFYKIILDVLVAHGGKFGTIEQFFSVKLMIRRATHYWSSNVFQYNYMVLILGVCAFLLSMYGMVVGKDLTAVILWMLVGSHWAQTFFLDNMTDSKATITFPILLLMIPYTFLRYGRDFLNWQVIRGKGRILFGVLVVGTFLFNAVFLLEFRKGLEKTDIYLLLKMHVLVLILMLWWIATWKKKALYLAFSVTVMFMVYASGKYVLLNRTYTTRDAMADMGKVTENGMVINGMIFGLYNQCDMPASIYDHYNGVGSDYDTMYAGMVNSVYRYDELYYIGIVNPEDEWSIVKLNELLEDSPYEFTPVKSYPIEWWKEKVHDQDCELYIKTERGSQ